LPQLAALAGRYGGQVRDEPAVSRDQLGRLVAVMAPEVVPPPQRVWSSEEWARICRGHRARDMDDKWLALVEHDRLFLHRSWTGRGVYEAQFARSGDGWSITELLVTGDRDSYRRATDAYEAVFVEALIDGVLLGQWDSDACARWRSMPREQV
jgi:hypothetical protein